MALEAQAKAEPVAPSDLVAEIRGVLAAHWPAVLTSLDEAIALSPEARVAWRPAGQVELENDSVEIAKRLLRQLVTMFEASDPKSGRASGLAGRALDALNRMSVLEGRRPHVPTRDEVTERIAARRDEAVKKIMQHTAEAAAKLAADRVELGAWAAQELSPRAAQELERRVGAMFGSAPS